MPVRWAMRVGFAECGPMGVAHHGRQVYWLEEARIAWLREHGWGYPALEPEEPIIPVTDVQLSYLAPARFGDELTVEAWLAHLSPTRMTFSYRILAGERLIGRGLTSHAFVSRQGRPMALVRQSPELYRRLREAVEAPQA